MARKKTPRTLEREIAVLSASAAVPRRDDGAETPPGHRLDPKVLAGRWFLDAFEQVRRGVASGRSARAAAKVVTDAAGFFSEFRDGSRAAVAFFEGDRALAQSMADAYGVALPVA